MPGHAFVQYALLTLFFVLLRIDPPSAPAVTVCLAFWEVMNRKRAAR